MSAGRHHAWLAVGVPVLVGLGLLAGGLLLLPDRREVLHAERRAQPADPVVAPSAPPPAPAPIASRPDALPPAPPSIAAAIPTVGAASLAAMTAQLIAAGQPVTTAQVAYDLVAAKRPEVALAYLAARPDGAGGETWSLRVDLLRQAGRMDAAAALVADAASGPGRIAPAALISAAYAVNRPDLIIAAAAHGAIPPPDKALALDLARRAEKAGRSDLIVALDRTTRADWRAADPWLAIRVGVRANDTAAALRAAAALPADQRDAARETIMTAGGDREGLRRLLVAQAAAADVPSGATAERLLAAGFRDDAVAVLRRVAIEQPLASPTTQRLLYLMGPRPGADDLAWLRRRTMRGAQAEQLDWIAAYASRDRPALALAFLARHPLAARTPVMLTRLALARTAGDAGAVRSLVATLLDGRDLDPAQLRGVEVAAPADPVQATAIAKRRIAAGAAEPRDAIDLAWTAWNAGDAVQTAQWLRLHLATTPNDPIALRLMADAEARIGGTAASRPWLERALAQTPPDSRTRVELLDRLGRRIEAMALVERLRAADPQDRALAALHARLLIAQGQPGRARAVLAR